MVIHPEVIVTPDCPTVKFRQPRDQVKLDIELPKILQAQGWGCGTYFHVQFVSHDKRALLAAGLFVVTEETESVVTTDDPYRPVTKTVFNRKVAMIGDWWEEKKPEAKSDPLRVSWNPGKKKYEVKSGEEVVFESADKQEATEFKLPAAA